MNNVVSGQLDVSEDNSVSWDATATLSYNRSMGLHNINLLAGMNATSGNGTAFGITYRGFPSGNLSAPGYAQSVYGNPSNSDSKSRLFGVLGTLNYSYNNIYLLDASVRIDGNSEFGFDHRYAPFYSGGVGLNLHNYEFFKALTTWVSLMKLRATYGMTGKVDFSPYEAQTIYQVLNNEWYKTGVGSTIMALGNPKLGWEKTYDFDIGVDADFFKGLIQLNASYYRKRTVALVNTVTLPASTGFTSYKDNIGEVFNTGFELQIRSTLLNTKDWLVSVYANMAHNKNRITKISDSMKEYNRRVQEKYKDYSVLNRGNSDLAQTYLQYVEGGSLTSIFGVKSLGINPVDGKEIFVRPDGSITYDWNATDQVVIGNEEPKVQGSFGVNVRWKQFTLYSSFLYECGGQRYNSTLISKVENAHVQGENVDRRVLTGRWQHIGDRTPFGALQTKLVATTRPTSRFVQNYNVLSMNSLTLGYDVNSVWLKRIHMGMLRIELSGNDLFRASTVRAERGLDYPYSRSFTAAVKMSF